MTKMFEHKTEERAIYKWWESQGYFKPEHQSTSENNGATDTPEKEPFVIMLPPPNVTGRLHMGHAMIVAIEDLMARYARMQGRTTLYLPGIDHAGIATQSVVEKQLASEGTSRLELGRDKFEERVWEWKAEYGEYITQQLRWLGASCDWDRQCFTLDPQLVEAVNEAFCRLADEGLIYRGNYMVNWSPKLQTAISDIEVVFSEEQNKLYYFNYPLADSTDTLLVATTRPETILGDTAVCVNPNDERYAKYIGQKCKVPTTDRVIPIIGDDYVDMEFGTGVLKITPAHDPNDFEIGKRHNLETITIMDKNVCMNAQCGKYEGMERFEARKALWADLQEQGIAVKAEDYTNKVPRSERSGEIVEPLLLEQWFVKLPPLTEPVAEAARTGQLKVEPSMYSNTLTRWLDDLDRDWCVSRQLWWGHRIPAWYVFDSKDEAEKTKRSDVYVTARSEAEAYEKAKKKYGDNVYLYQEEDVLDTWFSSGLWPFSTLGWPNEQSPDLIKYYPNTILETGHDILFFWVARMCMFGLFLTKQLPFSIVYLHGLVRDDQGRKMSKSLGNVTNPLDIINEYGTDALRHAMVTGTSAGVDLNLQTDRFFQSRNLTNKLWNAAKFAQMNYESVTDEQWSALCSSDFSGEESMAGLGIADKWVVSKCHAAINEFISSFDSYRFADSGRVLTRFFWDEYADWYVESAKADLYSDDVQKADATRSVMAYVFRNVLKLMHPFMPFITEKIWASFPTTEAALITAKFPMPNGYTSEKDVQSFELVKKIVVATRKVRKDFELGENVKIEATVVIGDSVLRNNIQEDISVLTTLAKLDGQKVKLIENDSEILAQGSDQLLVEPVQPGISLIVPLNTIVDVEKQTDRLNKQRGKLLDLIQSKEKQLSNEQFVSKAPANVVQKIRDGLQQHVEELKEVDLKIEQTKQLAT